MNKHLLQIRWCQVRKELKGIGLLYALAVLALLLLASGMAWSHYRNSPDAYVVALLVIVSILGLHLGRNDTGFVRKHIPDPARSIFTEYVVLSLPFTLPVLATRHAWLFIVMQLAFAGIARLSSGRREVTRFPFLSAWIPPRDVEWLSGVRKSFVFLLLLYVAAWATCWIMIAPLVFLWLITVQAASFYIECESLQMLRANQAAALAFLRVKIMRHSLLLLLPSFPVLLVNTLFCPAMWWLNLSFAAAQIVMLSFAILLKYALFIPEKNLSGNNLLMCLAALSVAVPFLLPLPLLMNIRNYGRAIRNLKNYLHD